MEYAANFACARHKGMGAVFWVGGFAGEVEESREMALPVAAQGAQILQFFPYDDSLPMARKLVFSRGRPVASAWSALKACAR